MTDTIVRTYDPKQIIVTFGGIIFSGFAEGTFLQITRSGEMFVKQKGADGSINRTNKNAFDFTVTVTLQQTSITNDLLSGVMVADQKFNTGALPLIVKDLRGTTLFFAPQAWIESDPEDEYSDEATGREWVLATGIAEKFTGGSLS
jgi:hypothetical protein